MGISLGFGFGPLRVSVPLRIPIPKQRQRYGYTTAQYVNARKPRKGWYPNPAGNGLRYFDGKQWTNHYVGWYPNPTGTTQWTHHYHA